MKFLFGFAIGVALGMLYAPAPGEETRSRLFQKGEHLMRQKAIDVANITKEKAGEVGGRIGRRAAEAAVEAVKEEVLDDKTA